MSDSPSFQFRSCGNQVANDSSRLRIGYARAWGEHSHLCPGMFTNVRNMNMLLLQLEAGALYASAVAGSGAARLARSVRDAEVGGSNPLSPTNKQEWL